MDISRRKFTKTTSDTLAIGVAAAGAALPIRAADTIVSPGDPHKGRSSVRADVNLTTVDAGERLEVGPTRIRVLEDGSRTGDRIGAIASILPSGVSGPPEHRHLMHDETFLVTRGVLRFILGDTHRDAKAGDYVVVPVGATHTFANVSDAPVEFFSTFTPAYYVNYFRELAELSADGRLSPEANLSLMLRYATIPSRG